MGEGGIWGFSIFGFRFERACGTAGLVHLWLVAGLDGEFFLVLKHE
jgi:hypothetical protein